MAKYKAVEEARKLANKQTAILEQAMERRAKLGESLPCKSRHGVTIATPAVEIDGRMKERIEAAVRATRGDRFKRLKLNALDKVFLAQVLNLMLEAHPSVHAQMLHPCNGQFDAGPMEAARSFVRSFAARHRIPGVPFDKAYYK